MGRFSQNGVQIEAVLVTDHPQAHPQHRFEDNLKNTLKYGDIHNQDSAIFAGSYATGIIRIVLKKSFRLTKTKNDTQLNNKTISTNRNKLAQHDLTGNNNNGSRDFERANKNTPPTKLQTSPDTSVDLLTVRLFGKEKVRAQKSLRHAKAWALTNGNGKALDQIRTARQRQSKQQQMTNTNVSNRRDGVVEAEFFHATQIVGFPKSAYDIQTHSIQPGTYEIPFCFALPSELPSTTSYDPTHKRKANQTKGAKLDTESASILSSLFKAARSQPFGFRIQYKLQVELHASLDRECKSSFSLKAAKRSLKHLYKRHVCIRSSMCQSLSSSLPINKSIQDVPFSQLLFLDEEQQVQAAVQLDTTTVILPNISLSGHLADGTFASRSTSTGTSPPLCLRMACQNQSDSMTIQRVDVEIVETLRWTNHAPGYHDALTGSLNHSTFHEGKHIILKSYQNVALPTLQMKNIRKKQSSSLVSRLFRTLILRDQTSTQDKPNLHCSTWNPQEDLLSTRSQLMLTLPQLSESMEDISDGYSTMVRTSYTTGRYISISHHVNIIFRTKDKKPRSRTTKSTNQKTTNTVSLSIPIKVVNDSSIFDNDGNNIQASRFTNTTNDLNPANKHSSHRRDCSYDFRNDVCSYTQSCSQEDEDHENNNACQQYSSPSLHNDNNINSKSKHIGEAEIVIAPLSYNIDTDCIVDCFRESNNTITPINTSVSSVKHIAVVTPENQQQKNKLYQSSIPIVHATAIVSGINVYNNEEMVQDIDHKTTGKRNKIDHGTTDYFDIRNQIQPSLHEISSNVPQAIPSLREISNSTNNSSSSTSFSRLPQLDSQSNIDHHHPITPLSALIPIPVPK